MTDINHQLAKARQHIVQACIECSRNPSSVSMLAVSKHQSAQKIAQAYAAGQKSFGENYVQEALEKQALLSELPIEWHLIGRLQNNKAKKAAMHFAWIHTVDSLALAKRLSAYRSECSTALNICLQLNVHNENSKSGLELPALLALSDAVVNLPHLQLRGLMCIPPKATGFTAQCENFAPVSAAFSALCERHPECDTLSMGMSADYKAAIFQGSTVVRIGTNIFGARDASTK